MAKNEARGSIYDSQWYVGPQGGEVDDARDFLEDLGVLDDDARQRRDDAITRHFDVQAAAHARSSRGSSRKT